MSRFNMRCAGWFVVGLGALMVGLLSTDSAKADLTVDGSIFNATFPGDAISATDWPTAFANGGAATSIAVADNTLSIQGAVDYVAFVDSKTFTIPDPTKYAVQVDFHASSVFATNNGGGHEWELFSGYAGAGGSAGKAGIDLCLYGPANLEQTQYNLCWNRDEANIIAVLQLGQSYSVVAARDGGDVNVYIDGTFTKRVTPLDGTPVCIEMGDGYQSVSGAVQYTRVAVGEAVPEPSCVALVATAGLALLAYAWRKRKA
jgi:hypothetical protein